MNKAVEPSEKLVYNACKFGGWEYCESDYTFIREINGTVQQGWYNGETFYYE